MAKSADFYYKVHPWKITEEGFNKDYALVSESIFSLGNEYMGTRGSFEEGYSGDSLLGYYFNGIYERTQLEKSSYKGIVDETEFIVNSADWLYTRIEADGELLDLNTVKFKDFYRELDLKSGILTRSYLWILTSGKEIRLEFIRFLSMKEAESAAQKIIITPLNFSGEITLHSGIDFTGIHQMTGRN
ncbi:MAG: glycoside hydrolase family 65 protein, partial [Lacrimispora sphenoides]